ncbi:MAG: HEPN domain-containing protein [Chloroflexota bacterium]
MARQGRERPPSRGARIDGAASLLSDSTFHCQQAAEKAMKGFLAWHNVPFRRVHSLEEIGEQCLQIEPELRQILDRAVPLTEYAWKFRYPGELAEPTATEAQNALATAHAVYQAVLDSLPRDVHALI